MWWVGFVVWVVGASIFVMVVIIVVSNEEIDCETAWIARIFLFDDKPAKMAYWEWTDGGDDYVPDCVQMSVAE